MAASPSSPRPAASPAASPVASLGRTAYGSPSSPGQRSPLSSPSYGRTQAATPTRVGVESPELHINDHGPVTLFSSLMAGWMSSVSMGTSIGYSLPAGQSLSHDRSNITRSGDQQLFWYGCFEVAGFDSLLPLAAVFGSMWGCCLAFWLGRRWTMVIGSMGSLCAWIALGSTSTNTWNLYTTRFLVGLATGVVSLIAPAYIAEIASAKDRGKQCGTVHTGIAAGVLYTYLVGRFTDWSMLALWCAVPSALSAVLAVWAVESPRWLMEQGKHDEAQAALRRLRFITSQADGELQAIEVIYVKSPTPVCHYILAVMIIVLQQFSGVNMIMHYATGPLLTTSTSTSRDFYIILASVQLVTTALTSMLLDMFGRVKPLAVSVTVCTCSMVALGSVFTAFSNADGNLDSALGLDLTNACKVVFAIGYSVGLGPATWVLVIELAPLRGRGFDFCTVCIFHWVSALAVINLVSARGPSATSQAVLACVAGGVTFAGGIAAFFILPDTSCVSLETILLEGQKNRPKKPAAPLEFASSTTQLQKEEQKKEQMQRKVAALLSGSSTTQLQKDEQEDEWNPSKAADFRHASIHPMAAVRTSKRTLQASSHAEPKSSRVHNSRNDASVEDPKKGPTSPNIYGGGTATPDKVVGATLQSSLASTLLLKQQQWET
ncbi:solute carrier family 2, facilitated glucose transporter member 8 [Dermacentor silvarum]|uniref:solute carrier family 2, facilitated glucose transporter member 8 n=1 Tax=Dermacentor silvarum TaxID=543639 RepID=UPI001897631A|nr:solute carrier family 2, facilitated glucose transporter member 8 [Dermacentor silvarum]